MMRMRIIGGRVRESTPALSSIKGTCLLNIVTGKKKTKRLKITLAAILFIFLLHIVAAISRSTVGTFSHSHANINLGLTFQACLPCLRFIYKAFAFGWDRQLQGLRCTRPSIPMQDLLTLGRKTESISKIFKRRNKKF